MLADYDTGQKSVTITLCILDRRSKKALYFLSVLLSLSASISQTATSPSRWLRAERAPFHCTRTRFILKTTVPTRKAPLTLDTMHVSQFLDTTPSDVLQSRPAKI